MDSRARGFNLGCGRTCRLAVARRRVKEAFRRVFGVSGIVTLEGHGLAAKIITLFIQYIAIISFGMFCTNLFPVSTFDMGLLIAGYSSRKYLGIIKMDAVIKVILIITVFVDLINYGSYRLISFLL